MQWLRQASLDPIGRRALDRSIAGMCGTWSRLLASDHQIRLCLRCLDEGHLPACLQLEGIVRCPIHGLALATTCPKCGAPTPPYAIDAHRFIEPLRCSACGVAYSDAWARQSSRLGWSPPHVRRLPSEIDAWLRRIDDVIIAWPDAASWMPAVELGAHRPNLAAAALNVLRAVVPGCPKSNCFHPWIPGVAFRHQDDDGDSPLDADALRERATCYGILRRELISWARVSRPASSHFYPRSMLARGRASLPVACAHDPHWHALHIWRSRFEAVPLRDALDRLDEDLTPDETSFAWPGFRSVPTSTWLSFVCSCWFADVAAAARWHQELAPLLASPDRLHQRAQQLYDSFAPLLSPWRRLWSAGVTWLYARSPNGGMNVVIVD
jgi:hypothetical protein